MSQSYMLMMLTPRGTFHYIYFLAPTEIRGRAPGM